MIVAKISITKVIGFNTREENYVLKEDEVELQSSDLDNLKVFINPKFLNGKIEETVTQEEIAQIQIEAIKSSYENHKQNGWNAYQDFRAKIVVDISNTIINEAQAFQIESALNIAYNRIANTGDWKTAYYELSQVTGFDAFIQPYYDQSMIDIGTYITENY